MNSRKRAAVWGPRFVSRVVQLHRVTYFHHHIYSRYENGVIDVYKHRLRTAARLLYDDYVTYIMKAGQHFPRARGSKVSIQNHGRHVVSGDINLL